MLEEELARCRKQIQTLREENDQLRRASFAFGALADRLNDALREVRSAPGPDPRDSRSSFGSRHAE